MNRPPEELLETLLGTWSVERRLDPAIGVFTGSAEFAREPGGFAYREQGLLELTSGWTGPASRAQRWRADADGIDVLFAGELRDGELLHRLRVDPTGRASDSHLCGADRYAGVYEFGEDEVRIAMDVCGPAKAYVATTVLRRIGREGPDQTMGVDHRRGPSDPAA